MKNLLRRLLSNRGYEAASRFKNQTIPGLSVSLLLRLGSVLGCMIKILPGNSQVALKSGINIARRMDYRRRDILLSVDSILEYRFRLNSCAQEPETVNWIETFLEEGDVFYDVGANVGAYSLVASKFFDGKVKVYAFEPGYTNFSQLCKNLEINGCHGNVVGFPIALSDETGMDVFNYDTLVAGGAMHTLGEAVDILGNVFTPVSRQPILTFRADDFIKQFQIPAPNHIKIDVDGTEFSVLKGMGETLASPSVRSLMLEINHGRGYWDQIIEFLARKGLNLHTRFGGEFNPSENHLFVRAS